VKVEGKERKEIKSNYAIKSNYSKEKAEIPWNFYTEVVEKALIC